MAYKSAPMRIKYVGEYDLKKVVSSVNSWCDKNGYDPHEKEYIEKTPEIEITIIADRNRDEYWQDIIEVYFHMYGVKDLGGGKVHARVLCLVNASAESAYVDVYGKSSFKNTPTKERFLGWLEKGLLKKTIELEYEDVLYYDARSLVNHIKEALGMEFARTRRDE